MKKPYTYIIRDESGAPVYVGKGTGSRCASHLRRPEILQAVGHRATIEIEFHFSDRRAFTAEALLIAELSNPKMLNVARPHPSAIEGWDNHRNEGTSMHLIDANVHELSCTGERYIVRDDKQPGFFVMVSLKAKTFYVQYDYKDLFGQRKTCRKKLGRVGQITAVEARAKAAAMIAAKDVPPKREESVLYHGQVVGTIRWS